MSSPTEIGPTGNTYDKYGSKNPIERRLLTDFFNALDRFLPDHASSVLEVGAGEGEIQEVLRTRYPDANVIALDLPDPDLAAEWTDRSVRGVAGDAHTLPFPDGSFDLVVAVEVLEHVARPADAVAELARVAQRHLVASVPREPVWRMANMARGKYLRDLGNTPGHVNHWSSRAFRRLLEDDFVVTGRAQPFPWTVIAATRR